MAVFSAISAIVHSLTAQYISLGEVWLLLLFVDLDGHTGKHRYTSLERHTYKLWVSKEQVLLKMKKELDITVIFPNGFILECLEN